MIPTNNQISKSWVLWYYLKMIITTLAGIFIFLFLYWRRLKDDYPAEKIFNSAFLIVFGVFLSLLISKLLLADFWFWVSVLFLFLAELFIVLKIRIKFYESLEAAVSSLLPWLSLLYLSDSIQKSSLTSFLAFWLALISLFLYFLLKNYYRTFSWYKSGKVGFSGLVTIGFFFISRLIFSLFSANVISFAGFFEPYISGTIAFLSFLLLLKLTFKK